MKKLFIILFVLLSYKATAQPKLRVPQGGTGLNTLTAYALMFGGTTSTGAMQQQTLGSSGQVLTSNGAGALPTWQTASGGGMSIGGAITSATSGSVLFANSSNQLAQDNTNLFWDATNHNLKVGSNLLQGYTTTVSAAGTTTLTVGSTYLQFITGTTTQTIQLPVASTLVLGQQYFIKNNSTGAVTINSSGGNAVLVLATGTRAIVTCILTSGTDALSWGSMYLGIGITSGKKLSATNTLTLSGTDATTMTFPTTSATIARTDAANTFTGLQTFGIADASTGYRMNGAATTNTILKGNGTNYVASIETYAAPGAEGGILQSDGTNFIRGVTWLNKAVSSSDFAYTGQTLADIAGLLFTATASTSYFLDCWIGCLVSAVSTGVQFAVNSTGTSPTLHLRCDAETTSGTASNTFITANNTATVTLNTTSAGEIFVHIYGWIKSGTGSPTISIRTAKITSGTVTIRNGSFMNYRSFP